MWFNELDAYPAQWLRNLWPEAIVDERSICDLTAGDVVGPRAHFFGGIGGWQLALELAGWPDDAPVWTGSCPCQPFSAAGSNAGVLDARHLWPAFHRLIAECRPPVIFGEQVASKAGRAWLAGVRTDLEALGYAVGAADLAAASVGAPHIRQRLFWVAESQHAKRWPLAGAPSVDGWLGDADADGRGRRGQQEPAGIEGASRHVVDGSGARRSIAAPWSDAVLLPCLDGKARRTQSGLRPLAHGVPARVGRLRAYGNAFVPQIAAEFVRAYMETRA